MSENRVEGAFQRAAGTVQDAVGGLTGDTRTQAAGKARQAAGSVQSAYGEIADQARDAAAGIGRQVNEQPLAALLIVGVVGFLMGWFAHQY